MGLATRWARGAQRPAPTLPEQALERVVKPHLERRATRRRRGKPNRELQACDAVNQNMRNLRMRLSDFGPVLVAGLCACSANNSTLATSGSGLGAGNLRLGLAVSRGFVRCGKVALRVRLGPFGGRCGDLRPLDWLGWRCRDFLGRIGVGHHERRRPRDQPARLEAATYQVFGADPLGLLGELNFDPSGNPVATAW